MDLYKTYETDLTAEVEGVWITLTQGAQVRVARWLNSRHVARLEELRAPYRDQLRAGIDLPKDVASEINCRAMAETILVDWNGVSVNGAETPYDKDIGYRALKDLKDFREDVINIAMSRESFRVAALKSAAKNSKGHSITNSETVPASGASRRSSNAKAEHRPAS